MHHRRRVNVDLQRWLAPREHVALEIRRDVDDERVTSGIHQRNDVALGDRPRRLKQRRQEGVSDAARKLRVIFVDDRDGGVVKLL